MSTITKVRIINWHKIADETIPLGNNTLFVGKNGAGKTTIMDAIQYALFSNTNFNGAKSGKGKGGGRSGRTLDSYTRGLINQEKHVCLRPAKTHPEVYTHIIFEAVSDSVSKPFILGTVIRTDSEERPKAYRYVLKNKSLNDFVCTHSSDDGKSSYPYTKDEIKDYYGVHLYEKTEDGVVAFFSALGFNYPYKEINGIKKIINKIINYDKNADIPSFIKENVLEEKENKGFTALAKNRESIEAFQENLEAIKKEENALQDIINVYDDLEKNEKEKIRRESALNCIALSDLNKNIEDLLKETEAFKREKEEKDSACREKEAAIESLDKEITSVKRDLEKNDCGRAMSSLQEKIEDKEREIKGKEAEYKKLVSFQQKVNELSSYDVEDAEVLSALSGSSFTRFQKKEALKSLKNILNEKKASLSEDEYEIKRKIAEQKDIINGCEDTIKKCGDHEHAYNSIKSYVELRDRINEALEKKGISSRARLACDYVTSLKDEAWRNVIESVLGRARYTVLVEPEGFDTAFELAKDSDASVFNTRLLIKNHSDVKPVENSLVNILNIEGDTAKLYFTYRIGMYHAVDAAEVKNFEYAASKEGVVSRSMDCYRVKGLPEYYLGDEAFRINEKNAQEKKKKAEAARKKLSEELSKDENLRKKLENDCDTITKDYDFDAERELENLKKEKEDLERQLKEMKEAKEGDEQYVHLLRRENDLKAQKNAREKEKNEILTASGGVKEKIKNNEIEIHEKQSQKEDEQAKAEALSEEYFDIYQSVEEDVKNGKYAKVTKKSLDVEQIKAVLSVLENERIIKVNSYNTSYGKVKGQNVQVQTKDDCILRKKSLEIADESEIQKRLDEDKKYYRETFKNIAVLGIYKACREAKNSTIKRINKSLRSVHFGTAEYEFKCSFKTDEEGKDGEYAKILNFAEYIDSHLDNSDDDDGRYDRLQADTDYAEKEREIESLVNNILADGEERIKEFSDYRNYMEYDIIETKSGIDGTPERFSLSKQNKSNSGAETQIPYLLTLISSLITAYGNDGINPDGTRFIFFDEPFTAMDPDNIREMMKFLKNNGFQAFFFAPGKIDVIGSYCDTKIGVQRLDTRRMLTTYISDDSYAESFADEEDLSAAAD